MTRQEFRDQVSEISKCIDKARALHHELSSWDELDEQLVLAGKRISQLKVAELRQSLQIEALLERLEYLKSRRRY